MIFGIKSEMLGNMNSILNPFTIKKFQKTKTKSYGDEAYDLFNKKCVE